MKYALFAVGALAWLALVVLTGCTSGPTREEHEATIAELREALRAAQAEIAHARAVVPALPNARAVSCEPEAAAEQPPAESALNSFTERKSGRSEMYAAFRNWFLQTCAQNGCGVSAPSQLAVEISGNLE